MKTTRTWVGSLLLAASSASVAGALDINLNNDSVRLALSWMTSPSPNSLEGEAAIYYNTDDYYIGTLGVRVVGETGRQGNPLEAGVGGKLLGVLSSGDDEIDGLALGLGFGVRYYPETVNRLVFGAQLHYAPDIVSFGDVSNAFEGMLNVEYQILPQAFAYVGYRLLKIEREDTGKTATLDEGAHAGMRILFQ